MTRNAENPHKSVVLSKLQESSLPSANCMVIEACYLFFCHHVMLGSQIVAVLLMLSVS
jgi:hypothetical protein